MLSLGEELLRIGQVAKLSGLSTRTIDYYTRYGFLSSVRSESNYRMYEKNVLQTLERIKLLKSQRMSLDEISEHLQQGCSQEQEPLFLEVQEEIDRLQQKVTQLEESLKDAPSSEKRMIYTTLSNKLTVITQLLTLL
ncbi:MerR family transcriptional regulator [Jeotgalibacillus sp. ET6]|uniref:MerR family transcriptional regulator n=1 Tax=Jeotgalibacillus sp. ET6 TaxID=3037260 RepID=UPI002418375A|nr:MerR family transcriptional regulator [Jeotgalibacillus sp. ET6]MDG5472304.1 MerR family transcriptional regulator [Jeotgalibacillus sp. ET6]